MTTAIKRETYDFTYPWTPEDVRAVHWPATFEMVSIPVNFWPVKDGYIPAKGSEQEWAIGQTFEIVPFSKDGFLNVSSRMVSPSGFRLHFMVSVKTVHNHFKLID